MILVNGQPASAVSAEDRGLAYGDGVFRTLRTEAGEPLWWADQYAKLAEDSAALAIDCPDAASLRADVCRVAQPGEGVVKVILTRGSGTRGYAPATHQAATCVVMAAALPAHARPDPAGIAARWCALTLARQPRLAGIKHLNRLENVLARAEWDDPAILEGLLCDERGLLIGGVMSNVCWVKRGELFTPDLSHCGVAGVARARLLRGAARHGMPTHVGEYAPAAILDADEVMLCNSVIGLCRVARLEDATWSPAGWTDTLKAMLYEID